MQACSPLMLEFAVELCYPASEILTGGWIFLGSVDGQISAQCWMGFGVGVFHYVSVGVSATPPVQ